jgi:hypothetical protein
LSNQRTKREPEKEAGEGKGKGREGRPIMLGLGGHSLHGRVSSEEERRGTGVYFR